MIMEIISIVLGILIFTVPVLVRGGVWRDFKRAFLAAGGIGRLQAWRPCSVAQRWQWVLCST